MPDRCRQLLLTLIVLYLAGRTQDPILVQELRKDSNRLGRRVRPDRYIAGLVTLVEIRRREGDILRPTAQPLPGQPWQQGVGLARKRRRASDPILSKPGQPDCRGQLHGRHMSVANRHGALTEQGQRPVKLPLIRRFAGDAGLFIQVVTGGKSQGSNLRSYVSRGTKSERKDYPDPRAVGVGGFPGPNWVPYW